jgi:putative copper resistance protein D
MSAGVLGAGLGLVFLRQLMEFRDPFVPWQEDAELLLRGTSWGRTFLFGVLGSVLLTVFMAWARSGSDTAWRLALPAGLLLTAFPAFTGHASGTGGALGAGLVSADVIHVLAASAWIGGLAGILYLARRGTDPDPLPALVRVFSPVAVVSVATLTLTGIVSAWAHVPGPAALLDDPYGQRLVLKVTIVGVVLLLGWVNWRRLSPRMGSPRGSRPLRRAALVELLFGQLVLVVTAVLVRTPPPG